MKNIDVRMMVSDAGVTYKAIAKELRITNTWLSTIMRYELSEFNRERITQAVKNLQAGGSNDTRS